ncbi:probable cytochrome P450 9f2 [Anopheles aquasalis]|uniref:probable cytochrome P450 9f2 n=1 Tax=Anopheles aquasalis TaxID=42839 RepID=UPI00215A50A9|nr:probable cytochrome P450 9f2 [Anopheles aquasalis]
MVVLLDPITLTAIAIVLALGYYYVRRRHAYFNDKPYPHLKPTFLLGSSGPMIFRTADMMQQIQKMYNCFPGSKVVGAFDFLTPNLTVRDPECLKQMMVKDFDHFTDHTPFVKDGKDYSTSENLFLNSLFMLRGQKWRDMRATLSPAFTGSKMRQMFELVSECGQGMVEHFLRETGTEGATGEYEMKDVFSRFANDVIATVAFGIRVNSLTERENAFYVSGKKLLDFGSFAGSLRLVFFMLAPNLAMKLGVEMLDVKLSRYFHDMILDNMRTRTEKGILRNDMINMLMQVKKGSLKHHAGGEEAEDTVETKDAGFATVQESSVGKSVITREWSDRELVSQCFLFFLAGFDTVSTALGFMMYELTVNPEVQERLYREVLEVDEELAGKPLSYDAVQGMRYMDMVVSESLRKWPPAPIVDRYCTRDYTFDDGNGLRFTVEQGRTVFVPVAGLHHDPKYYPNPSLFDPERFSEENKDKINPTTYLPFGIGPRNCIGSRFALMEVKSIIYYMLKSFTFERCERTQVPLKLKSNPAAIITEKGIWIRFKPRVK